MNETFLRMLLESGALKFGSFKTKSGRISPYFINTGCFDNGKRFWHVTQCYADLLEQNQLIAPNTVLFGPAYKGIPLVVGLALTLFNRNKQNVSFCFNRKEPKDHGEGGNFIGVPLTKDQNIIIIEDVLTQGTSVAETIALLKKIQLKPKAVVLGVDREEFGFSKKKLARGELLDQGIEVYSLLRISDVINYLTTQDFLGQRWVSTAEAEKIHAYRNAHS